MKKYILKLTKLHSVRRVILFTYLVFVVLISFIGIAAQNVAIRTIEEQTRAVYKYALERAVAGIDSECQSVRVATDMLFNDPNINQINAGDSALTPTDAIARRDLHNVLSDIATNRLADTYVTGISICFPGRDYVLTDKTAFYSDLNAWSMLTLHTDMKTARNRYLSGYRVGSFYSLSTPDGSKPGFVYIRTLNYYSSPDSNAVLIVSIDGASLIRNNLSRFADNDLTRCDIILHDQLYSPDWTWLSAVDQSSDTDHMAAAAHSSQMNADFLVSISRNAYIGVMNRTSRVLLAGTFIFVVFGVLLAIVFTQESYRPIHRLSSMLPGGSRPEADEYSQIENSMRGLLNDVYQLNHELEQNRQKEKESLLLSLIRGSTKVSQVADLLERFGIRLSGDSFVAVVLDCSAPEGEFTGNPVLFRYAIQNVITEMSPAGYDSFTCADDSYVTLILCASSGLKDLLPTDAARCAASVMDFFIRRGTSGFFGSVSTRHDGADGIHAAYEESKSALKDPLNRQKELVICGDGSFSVCPDLAANSYGEIADAAVQYIRTIFTDSSVSTRSVADHFGYSSAYMGQLFKQVTGLGISEYIAKLRLEKAMQLVSTTDMALGDIVPVCGYYDRQAMSAAFKRYLGMTPSQYRGIKE